MKKRIFTIFLAILIAVTNIGPVYAAGVDDIANININNYGDSVDAWSPAGSEATVIGTLENIADGATGIIRTVIEILCWPLTFAQKLVIHLVMAILPSMDHVVFNDGAWGNITRLTFFDVYDSTTIAGKMQTQVSAVYQTFRYLALIGFVVAIACIAVKMIISSVGKQKQQYKESLKNWLFALVLLVVGHWIMIYMIYISAWLVDLIKTVMYTSNDFKLTAGGFGATSLTGAFADSIITPESSVNPILVLINLIVIIVFAAMNMKIFKVYLERVIVVAVLIMLFPLVALLYAFEKAGLRRGNTFGTWLNTFVSQVFIQPVHALAILFIVVVLNAMNNMRIGITPIFAIPIIGPILALVVINFVFKIEEVVKRVLAINGASMGSPIKPAAEMGKVANGIKKAGVGAARFGMGAANFKRGLNAADSKQAFLKDAGKNMLTKWGKKNGLDLDNMDFFEGKNVIGKMKADLKNGKITKQNTPEYLSMMRRDKNYFERLAKTGFNSDKEFADALGDPTNPKHFNARLALMDYADPGSADKYLERDSDDKFTGKIRGDADLMDRTSRVSAGKRKASIKAFSKGTFTPQGIAALKYDLQMENPEKYKEWAKELGVTDPAQIDAFSFTTNQLQAMAYCQSEGIEISEVMTGRRLDMTKVNPPKAAEKSAAIKKFVTEDFSSMSSDELFKMQQIAQSYDKEDRGNVDRVLAHTNVTREVWDNFKATGGILCDPHTGNPLCSREDLRTAFYYLDKPDSIPSGSGTTVMTERELSHAYTNISDAEISDAIKNVINAGSAFDTIGFDGRTADCIEIFMDKNPSIFSAALAQGNAGLGTTYNEDDFIRIIRAGSSATPNEITDARLILMEMVK